MVEVTMKRIIACLALAFLIPNAQATENQSAQRCFTGPGLLPVFLVVGDPLDPSAKATYEAVMEIVGKIYTWYENPSWTYNKGEFCKVYMGSIVPVTNFRDPTNITLSCRASRTRGKNWEAVIIPTDQLMQLPKNILAMTEVLLGEAPKLAGEPPTVK